MKTITTLLLLLPLLFSMPSYGAGPGSDLIKSSNPPVEQNLSSRFKLIVNPLFESKPSETTLNNVKIMFRGITNFQIGKNVKLKIITPGPFVKRRVALGDYPECYPARFSLKLFYSFS